MKIFYVGICFLFIFFINSCQVISAQSQTSSGLNHIALYVYDLDKSTAFYKDVIGLPVIPEPFHDGKHTWFSIGEHSQLHLIEGAETISIQNKNSHICFTVPSIDSFIILLNKNNISYEDWKGNSKSVTLRIDGIKQIYFKDPNGYWIEINDDRF